MVIYLMRHGETEWNRGGRLQGQSDIPLNEFGIGLAEKTAEGLKGVPFDAVFSSPLQRALLTAQIVTGSRAVSIETDDRLKEIHFGAGEGTRFDLAKGDESHPLHNFFCRPERYFPEGEAESFDRVRARAKAFLEDRIFPLEGRFAGGESGGGNILIVAHGAINRCILNSIAGIPDRDFWRINLPNCAVAVLSLEGGKLKILEESRVYGGTAVNGRP
ncbi:MAG: histidine phosphatase family protein [Acetatifactor muris]|nr:histidine phosphatase family protein [Acetatifactor muris]